MPQFNGILNVNKIYSTLRNMIISQDVFSDNVKHNFSTLADMSKVDGSMHGDTKLYTATDVLEVGDWGNDAEAENLLKLHRGPAPETQAITINVFKQIRLTVDEYLTKQAWTSEGGFISFNSVMLGWMGETKRIYETTLVNAFYGTHETSEGRQELTIAGLSDTGKEEDNRMNAMKIGEFLANLVVDLEDYSRDFNDYGNMRSYSTGDFRIIWNSKYINRLRKIDLPTIFHNEGLEGEFDKVILPARYFGKVLTANGTTASNNTTVRSLLEKDYGTGANKKHVRPGELLPNSVAYKADEVYEEDSNIVFKIVHKKAVPFMGAFSTQTVFVNPRSLTSTHFITFGHNTLEALYDKPYITVRKA